MIWKVSRKSARFPDNLESACMDWEGSGKSGKFLDNLESFRIIWKVFDDQKNP